jgi:IMP dehydrogenase
MARDVEKIFLGRTYDDFLVRPALGVVASRRDVALTAPLSRRLTLEFPVVSANMDSVTEMAMAKTMALEGGIGFIHRGMPIAEQVEMVKRVKRSQGYVVEQPLSLPRDVTIREAMEFIRLHNITGLLIEEARGNRILAGLLSNRDIPWTDDRLDERLDERVDRFMTPRERLVTGRPGIAVEDAERVMFEHRIEKLPLVDDQGRIAGLITKKDILLSRQLPGSSRDGKGRLLVGAAIGARGDFLERAVELVATGADAILIDIAHGHSRVMAEAVRDFRRRLGDTELIAGNIGTGEGARFLADLGVDAIKIGIGPGRGCRTRLETAAGVPQLQAVREAWCEVGDSVPLIADGGVRNDKDIFLAIACGASTVMLGSLLSGTDEAPGHVIEDPATREKRKIYRGMTSPQAVFETLYDEDAGESAGGLATPAEGQEVQIPYQGSVLSILHRLRGHLRSAVSYSGGRTLAEVRALIAADPLRHLIPLSAAARHESYDR